MAVRQAYSVYDNKVGVFMDAFFQSHDELAKRIFQAMCDSDKFEIKRHPTDFDLYRIGQMESTSGRLVSTDVPVKMHSATEFVPSK